MKSMKKSGNIVTKACTSFPHFKDQYQRLQRSIALSGKSQSTLINYARCLAQMVFHFQCSLLELDEEQLQDYLYLLQDQHSTPSDSYFKHTVYGLRYLYKEYGLKELAVALPSIKHVKSLPVVLSQQEVKQVLVTQTPNCTGPPLWMWITECRIM